MTNTTVPPKIQAKRYRIYSDSSIPILLSLSVGNSAAKKLVTWSLENFAIGEFSILCLTIAKCFWERKNYILRKQCLENDSKTQSEQDKFLFKQSVVDNLHMGDINIERLYSLQKELGYRNGDLLRLKIRMGLTGSKLLLQIGIFTATMGEWPVAVLGLKLGLGFSVLVAAVVYTYFNYKKYSCIRAICDKNIHSINDKIATVEATIISNIIDKQPELAQKIKENPKELMQLLCKTQNLFNGIDHLDENIFSHRDALNIRIILNSLEFQPALNAHKALLQEKEKWLHCKKTRKKKFHASCIATFLVAALIISFVIECAPVTLSLAVILFVGAIAQVRHEKRQLNEKITQKNLITIHPDTPADDVIPQIIQEIKILAAERAGYFYNNLNFFSNNQLVSAKKIQAFLIKYQTATGKQAQLQLFTDFKRTYSSFSDPNLNSLVEQLSLQIDCHQKSSEGNPAFLLGMCCPQLDSSPTR